MSGKKKWIIAGLLVTAGLAAVVVWRIRDESERVPEYVFSYAENQAADYPTTQGANYFAELVEERTEGRIQILVMPEAELGAEKDVLKQLRYGGVDFARVSLSQLAELIPEMHVLEMPYLYEDSRHMWKVLDGEIGDRFLKMADEKDLTGLSWYDAGVRSFYTSEKKITCLDDLQGMRIRVQESGLMADMVEALGAVPFQIPYSEVYSALQQGLVDGAENNWPSYEFMQHYEVAKYFTVDEHTRVPEMQLASSHTWEKLSEEDQKIIRECAEASALYERRIWTQQEKKSRRTAMEKGAEEIVLSEEEEARFREAVQSVYEKYCADYMDVIEEIKNMK